MIPSVKTCFYLMEQYNMLENIKAHSIMVARAASLIANGLGDSGMDISVKKTVAGALMHDIGKSLSLSSGEDHAQLGKRICLENNLGEIADIVAEHIVLKNYEMNGVYSEKEIVFYADKRVNHDAIVSLEDRLAYILERYGKNHDELCNRIKMNFELCQKVEEKLFKRLPFDPGSLDRLANSQTI